MIVICISLDFLICHILDEVLKFDLMSTNYDLYKESTCHLMNIFDFMVFLYESLISCAFSLACNMILTLTLQE